MTADSLRWRPVLRAAAWATCSVNWPDPQTTEGKAWRRLEPAEASPAADTLTILAEWGGGGKYHHTEVTETDREVIIRVLIEHHVPIDPPGGVYVATAERRVGEVQVQLGEPVGDRTVLGSEVPPSKLMANGWWMPAELPPMEVVSRGHRSAR